MIIGIGTDIVDIGRIQKLLDRHQHHFVDKIFTRKEKEKANSRKNSAAVYAKIFAAKEAFIKALGGSYNMNWHDMEISNNVLGKPLLTLSGNGLLILREQCSGKKHSIHLSLSDEPPYATAYVIIEACD